MPQPILVHGLRFGPDDSAEELGLEDQHSIRVAGISEEENVIQQMRVKMRVLAYGGADYFVGQTWEMEEWQIDRFILVVTKATT